MRIPSFCHHADTLILPPTQDCRSTALKTHPCALPTVPAPLHTSWRPTRNCHSLALKTRPCAFPSVRRAGTLALLALPAHWLRLHCRHIGLDCVVGMAEAPPDFPLFLHRVMPLSLPSVHAAAWQACRKYLLSQARVCPFPPTRGSQLLLNGAVTAYNNRTCPSPPLRIP
eukprot:364955-Chlamydomonas_euryale.AAC.8